MTNNLKQDINKSLIEESNKELIKSSTKKLLITTNLKEKIIPTDEEIKYQSKLEKSWCNKENKFVYNPKLRKHCPFCGGKFK